LRWDFGQLGRRMTETPGGLRKLITKVAICQSNIWQNLIGEIRYIIFTSPVIEYRYLCIKFPQNNCNKHEVTKQWLWYLRIAFNAFSLLFL
jgi:hypothetical protein